MKHTMSIEDFIEAAKISNYEDDLIPNIEYTAQALQIDDIIRELPKKYSNIAEEQLKELPELKNSLELALNNAAYDALIEACYDGQMKALQQYADNLVELINKIPDGDTKAINWITIDWKLDEVTIDFNTKIALSTTREIINGEGMFNYEADKEFACIYDGKYAPARTVIQHLHYLLDGKLINRIFGFTANTRWGELNWSCDYGDNADKYMPECIEKHLKPIELQFLQGKASFNLLKALELKEKQKESKGFAAKITKELLSSIGTLSTADKIAYESYKQKD